MVTIEEAVSLARRELLKIDGVVAVSYTDNTLVVYVETEEDRAKVPTTFMGFPVITKVVGRVRLL